jgi:hypothetical protein
MGGWKKHQPGCPCCAGPCITSFYVTACCSPASNATVTVKTNSGTTVTSGTTNSSGVVSLDLSGYTGQTLYAFVSYSTANYLPYTGVLLGNFCGRTYNYSLTPVSDTIGGTACGQVIVKTFGCDGTTPYGGINVALYQSGSSSPIATGTTDATTGIYTFPGLSTSYSYYVKAGPTPRSQPAQTTSTFTLTCSEKVDFIFNPTYPFVPTGISCPASYTLTTLFGGGLTLERGCAPACGTVTVPGFLSLNDPLAPNVVMGANAYTTFWYKASSPCTGRPFTFQPGDGPPYLNSFGGLIINTAGTTNKSCTPYWYLEMAHYDNGYYGNCNLMGYYAMTLNASGPVLEAARYHSYVIFGPTGDWVSYCNGPGDQNTQYQGFCTTKYFDFRYASKILKIAASSFTCSPFSAIFDMPAYDIDTTNSKGEKGVLTVPARTITVYA